MPIDIAGLSEALRRRWAAALVTSDVDDPEQAGGEALGPLLDALAEELAAEPDRLAAAVALGEVYESLLDWRASRVGGCLELVPAPRPAGCHYTPLDWAREVVRHTLAPVLEEHPDNPPRVLDPAVGGGVFLLAAFERLAARFGGERAAAALWGIDRDPLAARVARLALSLVAGDVDGRIVVADALLDSPFAGEFDAVVGNPPFLGGSFISGRLGTAYREALVEQLAGGRRGAADLCCYFLLRGARWLRPGGRLGMIFTSTVAEGDSRAVGLEPLLREAVVYRAERRRWPGRAATQVALIWLRRGTEPQPAVLDGRPVAGIDARLRAGPLGDPPARLAVHHQRALNGTKIYGQGFLLPRAEAHRIVAADPATAAVVRRYLSGDDLYGRADSAASRYVIDFGERTLEEAAAFGVLLDRVRRLVRPQRGALAGRNAIGDRRAAVWWRFGTPTARLEAALAGRATCLARVIHSATHEFVEVPADQVFSHALAIVCRWDTALFAALQSALGELWGLAWGSTLAGAPRYTLSRTLETFPVPPAADLTAPLAEYLAARSDLSRAAGVGLTASRRRIDDPGDDDPRVARRRAAQQALDRAVLAAYGWDDVDVTRGHGRRWWLSEAADRELLGRLRALNRGQAETERVRAR